MKELKMSPPLNHPPYLGCETGGRPKKYTDEFIEAEADKLDEWMKERKENIFIEDFCIEREYSFARVNEWEKSNEKFGETYEMFKMRQKVALFKGGLTKKLSFPMCSLILGHAHGVFAKTEQTVSGSAVNPLAWILEMADGKSKNLVQENE